VRWSLGSDADYQRAYELVEHLLLDVWATNRVEGWMDAMIPPANRDLRFPFPQTERIQNVQDSIDESERQRNVSRRRQADDFFDDFQYYNTISDWIADQAAAHPDDAQRVSIGNSYNGAPIYALSLGKDNGKPAFVVQCGIHAREWITPSTCCWIIDQLLNKDAEGPQLLADFEWIIIPVLNVDGYSYTHTNDRLWRKNRQPNSASTCIGTDINRNYAFAWSGPGASGNPCAETYYGPAAASCPETVAIQTVLEDYASQNRLASYFDIHAYGALWMSPWGYSNNLPSDYADMNRVMQIAANAVRAVNGRTYTYGSVFRVIYQTSGGSTDYSYGVLDAVQSYAVETFGSSFTPPASWIPTIGAEIWAGVKATAKAI